MTKHEQEMKKLIKLGKTRLVELCETMGLKASMKDTAKVMATWILDEVEDVNTMLEAKANAKKDHGPKKAVKKTGDIFKGNHPITGEKIFG